MTPTDLYLDLLARSLTGTLYEEEPDHDDENPNRFAVRFARHYFRENVATMLPRVRLDNIRRCIEAILRDEVPGDLIEAGVWRGGASIFIRACLNILGGADRVNWLADSFEGLPEPDPARAREHDFFHSRMMQDHYGRMAASYEDVQRNFQAYDLLSDRVRFLVGWFEDTLPGVAVEKVSLMRLDGDYYASTMTALEALYPRLAIGGFVIVDDYGEDLWTDCRQAVDEFRRSNDIEDAMIPVDGKCSYWRRSA